MRKLGNACVILLLLMMAGSCTIPLQNLTYMNGIRPDTTYTTGPKPDVYKIRPNDQLFIQVVGDDPKSTEFLNLVPTGQSYYASSFSTELMTYLVDEQGCIYHLFIGNMKVGGLTINEVRDNLQKEVDKLVKETSVFVRLVNRNITVLGEVRNPGQHPMIKNQLTIFEALGAAGDITDFGDRKKVKLVRETPDGTYIASINLTDPKLVSSDNYYILPHDVLYVEPLSMAYGRKTLPYGTGFSLAFSAISTAILIFSLFR